jgi:hypothetical protein
VQRLVQVREQHAIDQEPGLLRQGSGSLSMRRVKAMALCQRFGPGRAECTTSTSGICAPD